MSNVLTGSRPPSWDLVTRLASALGVDVMDILGSDRDHLVAPAAAVAAVVS